MADMQRIKEAFERNQKAIRLRPAIGQGTAVTKARVRDGLTIDVEDGGWKLVVDESKKDGGGGEGPDPGVFGRTALAGCLAIGYMMIAATEGVDIAGLEVEVQADYDARGMFDIDDRLPPGWSAMRYIVTVESDAPEADIIRVLDKGDRYSSLLYAFREPIPVEREVRLTQPTKWPTKANL
jgi:uncharacterized OsmC-like protein